MKSSLKLIIDATRIAINKSIENVTKKFSTKLSELEESIVKKFPVKLSELENDLTEFDTITTNLETEVNDRKTADESKMDKENPVGTGSFSMNRQDDSLIGDCSTASGCGTVANHFAENVVGTFNEYTAPCYDIRIVENQSFRALKSSEAYYADAYEIDSNDVVWLSEYKTTTWRNIPIGSYCIKGRGGYDGLYCTTLDNLNFDGVDSDYDIQLFIVESKSTGSLDTTIKGKRIYIHKVTNQKGKYAHVVGNGESNEERSNAHTVDWEGNAWYRGDVYTGGSNQDDTNAKKLATEEYVDERVDALHWDDIEDKPFYEIVDQNSKLIIEGDYTFTQPGSGPARFQMSNPAALLVAGENYRVTIDSVQYAVTAENSNNLIGFIIDIGDSEIKIQNGSYYLEAYDNKYNVLLNRTIHVKIEQSSAFLKTIEDKFIPDSIARKADIQSQVQVDWNETNQTSLSYIKNKPTTTALQSDWNESNITATSFIKNKPQGLSNFENDLYWAKETKELVLEISDNYQGFFDVNTYVCGDEWFCKENLGYELTLDGVTYTEKNSTIKEQNTNATLTAAVIEIDGYGEICFFRDENGFYVYNIRIDNAIKEHLSGTIKFYSKGITLPDTIARTEDLENIISAHINESILGGEW